MNMTEITDKAAELGYFLLLDCGRTMCWPTVRNDFTPEVYPTHVLADCVPTWEIQTTGYGPKSSEDIDRIIEGLQRGQKMVALLNDWEVQNS